MTIHLLGLAHLPTRYEYTACAFTQKILKLAKMFRSLGYTVYFYGVEGSEVECTEHVTVLSHDTWERTYGKQQSNATYAYDIGDAAYAQFTLNAIREIEKRKGEQDILAVTFGTAHQAIARAVNIPLTVEVGIGYEGVFAPYKIFESYAWMHFVTGATESWKANGHFFNTVIPNAIDPDEYAYDEAKEDYCLYLGRVKNRKGVDIAIEATKATGKKLIVAGQLDPNDTVNLKHEHVEYVGVADGEQRARLLAKAQCVFAPTKYYEPFGAIVVEAGMAGTPVITTDFGAFTETVQQGVTGYRCNTLREFVQAIADVQKLSPRSCREHALQYSLANIAPRYHAHFERLLTLFHDGWYTLST